MVAFVPSKTTTPLDWDAGRLRIATDAAGVALWAWNIDTDDIALDARAHRLWGVPPDDGVVTFEELSARIHPEDINAVRAAYSATRDVPGTFEIDFRVTVDDSLRWVTARGQGDDEALVGRRIFGIFLDVTERKRAEEDLAMLAGEMSHRVKNLFAIAAALTRIAARSATTPQTMADDLTHRLVALGEAHELVRPSLANLTRATSLGTLLSVLLGPYDEHGETGDRIHIAGPEVLVGKGSITTLALIFHELATNSLKHGALSRASGRLDVSCTEDADEAVIVWTETGGPPVAAIRRQPGFGSKLVDMSVSGQLGGSIAYDWRPEGLVVTLRANKDRLAG
jgi:two-component sensor histidine kinase